MRRYFFEGLESRCLLSALPNVVGTFAGSFSTGESGGPGRIDILSESSTGALKATLTLDNATNIAMTGVVRADKTFHVGFPDTGQNGRANFDGRIANNGHLIGSYEHFQGTTPTPPPVVPPPPPPPLMIAPSALKVGASAKPKAPRGATPDETGTFNLTPIPGTPRNMLGQYEGVFHPAVSVDVPFIIKIDTQHGSTFAGKVFDGGGGSLMTGVIRADTNEVVFAWNEFSEGPETKIIGTINSDGSMTNGQFFPSGTDFEGNPASFAQTISNVPASGAIDANFGTVGKTDVGFQSNDIAVDADGKIVVAGTVGGQYDIGRFNRDGTVDSLFATNGQFIGGTHATANSLAIQDDGKIILVGTQGDLSLEDPFTQIIVVRLNADGTIDTSFGDQGTTLIAATDNQQGFSVAVQDDGKIVVAGSDEGDFTLDRLNSDGTIDTDFAEAGQLITPFTFQGGGGGARSVTLQSDGKIIAVGSDADPNATDGSSDFAVARYNTDGSLDDTFGTAGEIITDHAAAEQLERVVVTPGGQILAGGFTGAADDGNLALIRYTSAGLIDPTFGTSGVVSTDFGGDDHATALILQTDGKIVTSGISRRTSSAQSFVARYNADGTLDTTFANNGKFFPGGDAGAPSGSNPGPGDGQSFADFFKTAKAIVAQQKGGRILLLVTTETGSTITQIVADGIPPGATVTAVKLTVVKKTYTFTITFSDNLALNSTTIKTGNAIITGPKKFKQTAKLVSVKTVGSTFSATYSVTGPAGTWDGNDNGVYNIAIQKNQVADSAGNCVRAITKAFNVKIAKKVHAAPKPRAVPSMLQSEPMLLASDDDDALL